MFVATDQVKTEIRKEMAVNAPIRFAPPKFDVERVYRGTLTESHTHGIEIETMASLSDVSRVGLCWRVHRAKTRFRSFMSGSHGYSADAIDEAIKLLEIAPDAAKIDWGTAVGCKNQ